MDEIVGKRLPRPVPTRWNFHSRTVNTVYEYREEILQCMETIEMQEDITHKSTIEQATGLKRTLKDDDFLFWLSLFHQIMPHVDILFKQMQMREIDPVVAKKNTEHFTDEISKIRNNVDNHDENNSEKESLPKRRRDDKLVRIMEAKEVCDVIICQAKERFSFTGHLVAANLFLPECFPKYVQCFPDKYLNLTVQAYPFLDSKKLRTELGVIYCRNEFKCISGAMALFSFIHESNLVETFGECLKLLKIIITIPMTTSEAERCFSTLKRVKTFLRNSMLQERLTALSMLSIEKRFISEIPDFNNKVIDKFAKAKERRVDFLYKSV